MQGSQEEREQPEIAAATLGQVQNRTTLRLYELEISGFKVYSDSGIQVGPLRNLNCILGPNGIGKSVLGEALAFALGANARMMRVKNLQGVISTAAKPDGSLPTSATVTLHFLIVDSHSLEVMGRLGVRRSVNNRGRAKLHTFSLEQSPSLGIKINNADFSNRLDGVEFTAAGFPWKATSQDELQQMLAPYGLHINALERIIITQHRRAMDVADPKKLAAFIESLIGGTDLRDQIADLRATLEEAQAEEVELDEAYEDLIAKSEAIAPEVQKWKRFSQSKLEYFERLAIVSDQRARALEREAMAAQEVACTALEGLESVNAELEAAREEADRLLGGKEDAESALEAAQVKQREVQGRRRAALELVEKARVREKAAQEALKRANATYAANGGEKGLKGLAKKMSKAQRQRDDAEAEVESMEAELEALQSRLCSVNGMKNVSKTVEDAQKAWKSSTALVCAALQAVAAADDECEKAATSEAAAVESVHQQQSIVTRMKKAFEAAQNQLAALKAARDTAEKNAIAASQQVQQADAQVAAHQETQKQLQIAAANLSNAIAAAGLPSDGGAAMSTVDAGVMDLIEQAQQGAAPFSSLTNAFHGRIHSVLRVILPPAMHAVNAVLLERCGNPATALVTSTRTAAEAVIDHFKHQKVGQVMCLVLEELASGGASDSSSKALLTATKKVLEGEVGGAVPLSVVLAAKEDIVGSERLISDLFRGWYLVADASTANKLLQEDRGGGSGAGGSSPKRRNFVTVSGALFKYDGEVVGERDDREFQAKKRYLLSTDYVVPKRSTGGSSSNGRASAEMEERTRQYEAAIAALENHEAAAASILDNAAAAHAVVASRRSEVASAKFQVDAAEKALKKDAKALRSSEDALKKARAKHQTAFSQFKPLQDKQFKATEALQRSRAAEERARSSYSASTAADPTAQGIMQLEENIASLTDQLSEAKNRVYKYSDEFAVLEELRLRFVAAKESVSNAGQAAAAATEHVSEAVVKAAQLGEELKLVEKELMKAKQGAKKAADAWRIAVERHQSQVTVQQHNLARIQQAQEREQDSLARAVDMGKESRRALEEAEKLSETLDNAVKTFASSPNGWTPPGSLEKMASTPAAAAATAALEDTSDMDIDEDDGADNDDVVYSPDSKRRVGASYSRSRSRRTVIDDSDDDMDSDDDGEREHWEDEEVIRALSELAQQDRDLVALGRGINTAMIEQASSYYEQLTRVYAGLVEKEFAVQQLQDQIVALSEQRCQNFHQAMQKAGTKLSAIFQRLTGGVGDAHCKYSNDKDSIFEHGVAYCVRPDNGSWRDFSNLSGGQQALAAVALCLALQAAAPLPFFFFDEIDAALDTVNAKRLAEFLKEACDVDKAFNEGRPLPPQILAVSHRWPVQSAAECLLGVFVGLEYSAERPVITVLTLYPGSDDSDALLTPKQVLGFREDGDDDDGESGDGNGGLKTVLMVNSGVNGRKSTVFLIPEGFLPDGVL